MRIRRLLLPLVLLVCSSKSWSQQCELVSIAGSSIWYPYAYIDNKKQRRGIGFDTVESILQEMEQKYEVLLFVPWKRLQQNLTTGELDILVSNHWTAERSEKWNLTSAIGYEELLVFTLKKNAFEVVDWLSLIGKEGVVSRGTALGKEYEKHKKHLSLMEIGSHQNGFAMLNKGFVDYFLLTKSAAAPFLNKVANRNIVNSDTALNRYPIAISFSKQSPCSHIYMDFEQRLKKRITSGWVEKLKLSYPLLPPREY